MPPHPKPPARPKKPGAMRSKPKTAQKLGTAIHAAMLKGADVATATAAATKSVKASKLPAKPKKPTQDERVRAARKARSVAKRPESTAPEGQTKTDLIIGMLKAPGGASSKEMEAATGWAPHSVRGLLGTLRKRGVTVISKKFAKGEATVYSIADDVGEVI